MATEQSSSDLNDRIAAPSPTKRAILEKQLLSRKRAPKRQSIPRRPEPGPCELSFAQQRLWFLDRLERNSPLYNISRAVRLHGKLNHEVLRKSLETIIHRHESLRTRFVAEEGHPVQLVTDDWSLDVPLIDLCQLSTDARENSAARLIRTEFATPFNLSLDLMLRATILRFGPEEHILVMVVHHIASDGWSMGVLFRELTLLYDTYLTGRPSPLPQLPIQYSDFASWQRGWLQGETLQSQLDYWQKQLDGVSTGLELPLDRPRPALPSSRGATETAVISQSLADAVRALSRQEGASLFMTLLAAFQTLLQRYTGQDDIALGSVIAGRLRSEVESLIGFFVNTLVLRSDLSGNPTFRQLLARVREVCLSAYANQDIPYEKLVEELQPERSLNRNPFFDVMFALQNAPRHDLVLHGLTTSRMRISGEVSEFDLTFTMLELAEGQLVARCDYNGDIFDASTIRRLIGHWETLLTNIVANPDQRIGDLELLLPNERHQLLHVWNDTAMDFPDDRCFHQLFEAQVEKAPFGIAVVFEDQQITYGELNVRANQLAHFLMSKGVGPDVLVGICLERSLEMVVALLAILKAGGAYVPLDPTYPRERLSFMLRDCRAPVLLTQTELANTLEQSAAKMICIDAIGNLLATYSCQNPVRQGNEIPAHHPVQSKQGSPANQPHQATAEERTRSNAASVIPAGDSRGREAAAAGDEPRPSGSTPCEPSSANLAYAIYTSGSTGKPKGVEISHRALVNLLTAMRHLIQVDEQDELMAVTTLSFDIAALELFLPLTVGARVEIVSREVAADGGQLSAKLQQSGVTLMQATPATWRILLEVGWPGSGRLRILCGGESMPTDLAERLLTRCGKLWNVYGPTETTIWSCAHLVESVEGPISVGRPLGNTQVYLLDAHMHPVPIGVPGEMYLGGAGLARGYLKRAELTAERFVRHPFAGHGQDRLYKTGDLARYRPDGTIEFLGRVDHQVKLRGHRIELGEIDSLLLQHSGVRQAVVHMRTDKSGDERLVAYVVPSDSPTTFPELREHLERKLPGYMVPSAFVELDALPLTPNGKTDRAALPIPESPHPKVGVVAPRNVVELRLVELWKTVLELEQISVTDNFFDLGGHSLLAVRLFAKIELCFGRFLPLASIFKAPTIEKLAAMINNERMNLGFRCLVPLRETGSNPPLFCVSGLDTYVFHDFTEHFGANQPLYGLQFRGLDGHSEPLRRIEDIAAEFVDELRSVQPAGPYHLFGHCFGGLVAYEMAQQLTDQKEPIALLAMCDTTFRGSTFQLPWATRSMLQTRDFLTGDAKQRAKFIKRSLTRYKTRIKQLFVSPLERQRPDAQLPLEQRLVRLRGANMQARLGYQPQPYSGNVLLLRSSKPSRHWRYRKVLPLLGWDKLVRGKLKTQTFRGNHTKILQAPKVRRLVKVIRDYLPETRTPTEGSS